MVLEGARAGVSTLSTILIARFISSGIEGSEVYIYILFDIYYSVNNILKIYIYIINNTYREVLRIMWFCDYKINIEMFITWY